MMNTVHRTLIGGILLITVFCGGGGITKAFTSDGSKTLVYDPINKVMVASTLHIDQSW